MQSDKRHLLLIPSVLFNRYIDNTKVTSTYICYICSMIKHDIRVFVSLTFHLQHDLESQYIYIVSMEAHKEWTHFTVKDDKLRRVSHINKTIFLQSNDGIYIYALLLIMLSQNNRRRCSISAQTFIWYFPSMNFAFSPNWKIFISLRMRGESHIYAPQTRVRAFSNIYYIISIFAYEFPRGYLSHHLTREIIPPPPRIKWATAFRNNCQLGYYI